MHDFAEPAPRTADPDADEQTQRLHLLKQSLQAAYGWDSWNGENTSLNLICTSKPFCQVYWSIPFGLEIAVLSSQVTPMSLSSPSGPNAQILLPAV